MLALKAAYSFGVADAIDEGDASRFMTSLDLTDTDVDFQTFGITLQGELFQRATTVLATLPAWNDRGFYISIIDDDPVRRSYDLVTHYVVCQERLLRNHNENIERWI